MTIDRKGFPDELHPESDGVVGEAPGSNKPTSVSTRAFWLTISVPAKYHPAGDTRVHCHLGVQQDEYHLDQSDSNGSFQQDMDLLFFRCTFQTLVQGENETWE